jgi:hypothetical protein
MARGVTKRQAESALNAVRHQFDGYDTDRAFLRDDGDRFVIVWEEGSPYQWTYIALTGHQEVDEEASSLMGRTVRTKAASAPMGVFAEPINHIELGLYPA